MAGRDRKLLESIGEELKENPPRVLAKTRRKKGAKAVERQRRAILLNKARSRGAKIRRKS